MFWIMVYYHIYNVRFMQPDLTEKKYPWRMTTSKAMIVYFCLYFGTLLGKSDKMKTCFQPDICNT